RIFHYPIVIRVLEAAQVMCFSVAAAQLRRRARNWWDLLALFVIFPATFFGANFGAGAAVIIGIHARHTTQLVVYLTTVLSIGCAVVLIRLAASFVPTAAPVEACRPEIASAPVLGRVAGGTLA